MFKDILIMLRLTLLVLTLLLFQTLSAQSELKSVRKSTASVNVHIIDTAFWIPQLKRTRKVWVYLPENYNTPQAYRFPVLYMQDGQNVFDDTSSFSGEWGVDEFLDTAVLKTCIVVAIENGGNKRMTEYNPYDNDRFGKRRG